MEDMMVCLQREEDQPLGIGFRKLPSPPYNQVVILQENSAAKLSQKVHVGDVLLSVNGRDVKELPPNEVRAILSQIPSGVAVTLGLRRPIMNGEGKMENGPPTLITQTPSPDTSPYMQRRMRRPIRDPVIGGMQGTGLDKIPESHSLSVPAYSGDKRLSLTPESTRKTYNKPVPMKTSKSLDLAHLPQWRLQSSQMVPLKNLIDGTELADRLHNKCKDLKFKDTGCDAHHCIGSQLWPKEHKPKRPYGMPRRREEVLPLAEDFIKQYFESKKHALGDDYEEMLSNRLNEVKVQVEDKGHYDLTYEELSFGARTAWRNAPRCVNRIVWRQLEILDARQVNTPKDMYDAIIHHIKYANNGGNLRSTITVFPHRTGPKSDFRVWNSQLIRYAGYKHDDGSVLGDPANVELTDICTRVGWTPPKNRTRFDVLPLVLQANGGEPQWFEIPKELVLEVEFSHPDYPWFELMGLKWYCLPAVSAMMLDVGGLEFPGVPFNGWYMSTEIGRDLIDETRYNLLKPIAQKMGLNLQTDKLWKDKTAVEVNQAVLYSFQRANVSIVDHHSATESFMTHMKAEVQSRGGCPADWVWIVPPISGSITPVFHQEMLLYYLTPSYEYQDDPWNHYQWPSARPRGRTGSLTFKTVANLLRHTTSLFKPRYEKRVKATILYATETGRSRNYANIVKDVFGQVFAAKVACMEEYNRANLESEQILLVVTSTFGSGDPPANGETFGRYLLDLRNGTVASKSAITPPRPRAHRMSTLIAPSRELLEGKGKDQPLTQVKYAVFGLGSRAYPSFCTFAHTCDNLLKDLGAEQVITCGEGDELCGQEESFRSWLRDCYMHACEVYKIDPGTEPGKIGYKPAYSKDNYRIQRYTDGVGEKSISKDLMTVHKKDIYPAVLKSRTKLQSPQSDRSTILLVLNTKGNRLHYEPGDHVAIYPQNNPKLVAALLERVYSPFEPDEPLFLESRRVSESGAETWLEERRLPVPVTLQEALTNYLDITTPPSPQLLKLLSQQTTRTMDKEELEELAEGGQIYEDWKYECYPNLLDVINQFHSLKVNVSLLLQELPLLQCRYYSISSSPRVHPNQIHCTVAIVTYRKKMGQGAKHFGVCSTWLNRLEYGATVPCFVRKAHSFHMPSDPRTPIIMVGPGTGIAPFRSFWQERMHRMNEALKSQLKSSNRPEPRLTLKPRAAPRTRRVTAHIAPVMKQLTPEPFSVPSSNATSPIRIRRSASDAGDKEELAKMLAAKKTAWGSIMLYFGCRRSNLDYIYREELMKAHISGALTKVNVALSREPNHPKTYVQHMLKKDADSIVKQLMEEQGHFFVCGDISMAADVTRTLQSIFEENAAMSAEEARRFINSMKDNGFYHEDIFGVTLKTAEVTSRVRTAAKKARRFLVSNNTCKVGDSIPLSPMTPFSSVGTGTPTQRSTVTLLSPVVQPPTPTAKPPTRPSAPEFYSPPNARRQRWRKPPEFAQSFDDGMALGRGIQVKIITDDVGKPILREEEEERKEERKEEEKEVEQAREVPVKEEVLPGKQEVEEQDGRRENDGEGLEATAEVQLRNMPAAKKQVRRIKSNSKVQTEV